MNDILSGTYKGNTYRISFVKGADIYATCYLGS